MKYLEDHPYADVDDMGAVTSTLGEDDDEIGPDTRELMTDGEFQAAFRIDPDDAVRAWRETHESTLS